MTKIILRTISSVAAVLLIGLGTASGQSRGVRAVILDALPKPVVAGYSGPGDVISGAFAWWGFRAYTAAYAASHGNVVQVCESTGVTCINITANTDGTITAPGVTACGGAACVKIKTMYDQSGNGRNLTQATAANMPAVNFTGNFSASVDGTTFFLATSGQTFAQPFSMSAVALRVTDSGANEGVIINGGSGQGLEICTGSPKNACLAFASIVKSTVAYTTGTTTAMNGLVNGASSSIYVDGTNTPSLNTGAGAWTGNGIRWQGIGAAGDVMKISEGGIWASDISSSFAALNTNQHGSWTIP